jgi:hypothetical protein
MDGKGNITVTAPETLTFNCKNMNVNVSENMYTTVGMNQTERVGMMKNLFVGANYITNIIGKMIEFISGNKRLAKNTIIKTINY